jgi:hypothetical protein
MTRKSTREQRIEAGSVISHMMEAILGELIQKYLLSRPGSWVVSPTREKACYPSWMRLSES